jgi:hypothetical protein
LKAASSRNSFPRFSQDKVLKLAGLAWTASELYTTKLLNPNATCSAAIDGITIIPSASLNSFR